MALTPLNDNIQLNAPKILDNRSGVFSAGVWRPYNDLSEFLATVNVAYRSENLMFYVRSTTNVNRADLYILDKNKSPYKLFDDIDLSNYYTKSEVDEMFGLRDLEIGINADDIVTERNRAIAAEALKANLSDIFMSVWILASDFNPDLRTYTNSQLTGTAGVNYNIIDLTNMQALFPGTDYTAITNGFTLKFDVGVGVAISGSLGMPNTDGFLKYASLARELSNDIIHTPGKYITELSDVTNFPTINAGYINATNGNVVASGSNKYSDYISIPAGFDTVRQLMLAGSAGGAFYDISNVYISGMVGTSSVEDYNIPTGAAYFRVSKNNVLTLQQAQTLLLKTVTTTENQLGFVENGVIDLKTYLTSERLNIGVLNSYVGEKAFINKTGVYILKTLTLTSFPSSGSINYTTGANIAAGGFNRTDYINILGYNKVLAYLTSGTTAGAIAFYDASFVYTSGLYGTTGLLSSYNLDPKATYMKVGTSLTKILVLINDMVLDEYKTGIVEDGTYAELTNDTETANVEVGIESLPIDNGTGISSGYLYFDSTTKALTLK
jgi:hypothetical protein